MSHYHNIQKEVYQKIAARTNQSVKNYPRANDDSANCLKVSLVPEVFNSLSEANTNINFNLMLAMEEENRYLQSIQFKFRYNTDILGPNVISNGVLNVGLAENIPSERYQLEAFDSQENIVEINLNAIGTPTVLLDQFYRAILKLGLDASTLSANPDFEFINQGFQENVVLVNPRNNQEETPECILPEFPNLERTCPVITSISPKKVAAGVLGLSLNNIPGTITIKGSGFGDPNPGYHKPHLSDVSFYDPDGGYFEAGELEYLSWCDTMIRMNVPTRSKNVNFPSGATQDLSFGASTNKIKLFTARFDPLLGNCTDSCTVFSQDSLFVHFGMFNDAHVERFQNIETCPGVLNSFDAVVGERRNLVNSDGNGGHTFFIENIYSNQAKQDSVVNQIIEGLDFYRCGYKFHFTDQNSVAANRIRRGSLSFGTMGTTLMMAESFSFNCSSNIQADNHINNFIITINENVLDEVSFQNPNGNNNIRFKFNLNNIFQSDTTIIQNNGDEVRIRDFQSVFLHEMGHALQLRHTNNPDDLMAAGSIKSGLSREITSNDKLGIEHAYMLSKAGTCLKPGMEDWPPCLTSTTNLNSTVEKLNIYPNPVDFQIHFNPNVTSGGILIYNLLGEIVWQSDFSLLNQEFVVKLPSNLSIGSYWVAIKNESGNIVQIGKFLKIQ